MQFLPPLTGDSKVIRRERTGGRHLPFAAQINDHSVLTHDGLLLQVLQLRGLLFETADTTELNYRKELRDAILRSIGSSRFAIYHHIVRRRLDDIQSATVFPDPFSQDLDDRWRARLAAKSLFSNDLYLTLVRRPLQGRIGAPERLRRWLGRISKLDDIVADVELRALTAAREALAASLSSYAPRALSTYDTPDGPCSEPLEFLSTLCNGVTRPVRLPHGDVAEYLPFRRLSFGQNAFEWGAGGDLPRSFGAMMSVKDYAGQSSPGMFDELLRLPVELTIAQSFAFVERGAALGRMNLALRRMRSTEDEAVSLRDDLGRAKDEVAGGRAGFGEHHMTIAVHASKLAELDGSVAEISAALADIGIIAVREDIGLEPAFWAQMPGNFKYIARRGLVSTTNFASFASGHNFAIGKARGNHWGDAVSSLETTASGPYFFNFHQGDLGNFTVIGPSGSGKTVIVNFLLAQARRFDPRIIFFDKDRGAEPFIRAIGGRYDRLSPDVESGLNPLQLDESPSNRQFLGDWLAQLAGGVNGSEAAIIKTAIDANFTQPPPVRRLRHLAELFRGRARPVDGDLWSRLTPWWGAGERAWLFDNEFDRTDLSERTVGFDMTAVLDDPIVRTPAMMVLFHRVEERLDGSPAIIVVDEGWKALDDEVFVRRIKDWEKTIRKRNGIVGFATQSARDALDSKIASAIIEQAATQIFTINPKANEADYCDGFGLTRHELDLVRMLPESTHCFLVRHGNESVVVRLDLAGEKDLLTILSGRERTVRALDGIRGETGDDPALWMPRLLNVA